MLFHGLSLLLWKNYLILKRKWLVTLLEIFLPCLALTILLIIRQNVESISHNNATTWESFEVNGLPKNLLAPLTLDNVDDEDDFKTKWFIAYSPNNSITQSITKKVKIYLPDILKAIPFSNEEQLERYLSNYSSDEVSCVLAAVVFSPTIATKPSILQYKLRFPYKSRIKQTLNPFKNADSWKTRLTYQLIPLIGPRSPDDQHGGEPGYYQEGFIALQKAIDRALIDFVVEDSKISEEIQNTKVVYQRMPYPPYLRDFFIIVIQNQLAFLLILAFIFASLNIVKNIVYEKEKGLKESLKMMGIENRTHWLAWFITYALLLMISACLMVILMIVSITKQGRMIDHSDPVLLFVFITFYTWSVISFSFAVSVFFKSANAGAAAGGILFFVSYLPYNHMRLRYENYSHWEKIGACFVPNLGMALGARLIGSFEGQGAGLQWNNLAQGSSVDDPFSMLQIWIMLLLDCIVYVTIACYVEHIYPGAFGIPKPWYFIFKRSFWNCFASKASNSPTNDVPIDNNSIDHQKKKKYFQEEPLNVYSGIQIRKLSKSYGRGKNRKGAVDNMNLNIYRDQITVLLGHNGAGKTTTMAMLSGFTPPTGGTAYINGLDIRTDMNVIRKTLGLCPQHDILFDQLTVEEHLSFFASLKGLKSPALGTSVQDMLERINLVNKRSALSCTLSGGMRRRLSIGIALVGGSEIVILDEPTSGLDPNARRELWTLLQRERANRTMLLTTHFMDEAEVLGDRIAIMAAGQIQCYGTPLFLKNCFGADYHLSLVKGDACDVQQVLDVVKSHVADYRIESNIGNELSILLPAHSSAAFEALFNEIETRKNELDIRNYGASVTTIEEVFLKSAQYQERESFAETEESHFLLLEQNNQNNFLAVQTSTEPTDQNKATDFTDVENHLSSKVTRMNTGALLFIQQFLALLHKRFLIFLRNKTMTISQMLIPVFFTIITLIIIKSAPVNKNAPALTLNMDKFQAIKIPFRNKMSNNVKHAQTANSFANLISNRPNSELFNVTDDNINFIDYLIEIASKDVFRYDRQYILAGDFDYLMNSNQLQWTAYFNNQPFHSLGILQNYISNTFLQLLKPPTNNNSQQQYSIQTINQPLPMTPKDKLDDFIIIETMALIVAVNLIFGMSFLISTVAPPIIRERVSKAKQLQYLSGCMTGSYWLSTFLWDLFNILLPSVLVILTFVAFQEDAYSGGHRPLVILFLFTVYAFSVIPLMYLLSHLFRVPSTGLIWLVILNILSGSISMVTVNVLFLPQLDLQNIGRALRWLFMAIFPNFCMGQSLADVYVNYITQNVCNKPEMKIFCSFKAKFPCCKDSCGDNCAEYNENYLGWQARGIGKALLFLTIQGCTYLFILIMKETSAIRSLTTCCFKLLNNRGSQSRMSVSAEEDEDVKNVRLQLLSDDMDELKKTKSLILQNVTKYYGPFCAVDGISCSVNSGNCLGLLGINGAGKTTTFKMLTGDLTLTAGDVYINGFHLATESRQAMQTMGYCPQSNALIDEMTGREQLTFYCRLRGVPSNRIQGEVEHLLQTLDLLKYANVRSGTYSGGNKRKLNTAIALVGSPPLVCLDEPSTGMDPMAKRQLWNTLASYRNAGNTLVLTSHSMEECEALCTQVVIMVNGRFQCFGSIQHLKAKFAEGYTVWIQVAFPSPEKGETYVQNVLNFVETFLGPYDVKDRHQGHLHIHLAKSSQLTWSRVFGAMESNRQELNIVHYSVTQTSLEQVFLGFARNQRTITSNSQTRCCKCCRRNCCGF